MNMGPRCCRPLLVIALSSGAAKGLSPPPALREMPSRPWPCRRVVVSAAVRHVLNVTRRLAAETTAAAAPTIGPSAYVSHSVAATVTLPVASADSGAADATVCPTAAHTAAAAAVAVVVAAAVAAAPVAAVVVAVVATTMNAVAAHMPHTRRHTAARARKTRVDVENTAVIAVRGGAITPIAMPQAKESK